MDSSGRPCVLVLDDDPLQLELVERSLAKFGFDVVTRRSGGLGVARVLQEVLPDIVLLDVNLPALSGDKVLGLVRQHAAANTFFIFYSASDESKLRALTKQAGADGYIPKSVQGPELALKLSAFWRKRESGAKPAATPPVTTQGGS